eukprot:TRINITY_DN66658_c1_g14_i1.p1 TRINITY_DN66658_c1_g14~~TRINITY_DN66658_c1_g14_i1.p1  ORF type:complete len:195 (+),score=28.13 TRINITY_DN66658_c1_g14_i1:30-614(+)
MAINFRDIQALDDLITDSNKKRDEKDGTSSQPPPAQNFTSPAQLGDAALAAGKSAEETKAKQAKKGEIWAEDELDEYAEDPNDKRIRPEFEILYKQFVGSSDVFLGVDYEKDPSTMKAEQMVVVLSMPECKSAAEVSCDIQESLLDIHTSVYKLRLPLPKRVYTNKGSCQWDKDKKTLRVTLHCNYEHMITKVV